MEEKQPPQKQIHVTEASIVFADGKTFHASAKLLRKLNERVSKENKISCPEPVEDCTYCFHWIET